MEISTARRNRKKENKAIIYLKENSIFAISFQSKRLYNINIIHMKLSKLLFIPLTGLFMGGCDMIDYHPYDVRISGQTDINNRNIEKIEANCKDKATIRFVTMGDSQRWYDETLDFVNHLNKRDDIYNPQIQISAESETKRSIFREKDKTKRSKKESAQHSKSRNKSFVMTSVSAL